MENRIIYAVISGAALFAVAIALRLNASQEGLQIILSFIAPLIVGIVAIGIKRGFILGFVLDLIYVTSATLMGVIFFHLHSSMIRT